MATTTPNFGWPVPTSTDLVKDGATAIEGLGDAIDASLLDLKGGTTGQVLAKASNTDMDFSWVVQDDANAIQNTQLTAKGALISAVSAGTPATLTVGTNNQVLTADSTTATGLKWATPAGGGGKVLQVVSAFSNTSTGTSSTTYVDTTLSGTITPTSATSKILVMVSQNLHFQCNGRATFAYSSSKIVRNSTDILSQINSFGIEAGNSGRGITGLWGYFTYSYLDNPSTTSATTYKTQFSVDNSGDNITAQESGKASQIILLEIGA